MRPAATASGSRHRAIAAVGEAIEGLQFNKSVAALYELANAIEKSTPSATRDDAIHTLLLLSHPAPRTSLKKPGQRVVKPG